MKVKLDRETWHWYRHWTV